jgi:hypothetical protein
LSNNFLALLINYAKILRGCELRRSCKILVIWARVPNFYCGVTAKLHVLRLHRSKKQITALSVTEILQLRRNSHPSVFCPKIHIFCEKKTQKNVRKNEQILFFVVEKLIIEHTDQILYATTFFFSQVLPVCN